MKGNAVRFFILALLFTWLQASFLPLAHAAGSQRYISDTLFVPMRSGVGNQYRIVHRGLKSGTPLTLIQEDKENGWSQVRTNAGIEGWLRNQYLTAEPTADIKLAQAEKTIDRLSSKAGPLSEKLLTSEKENQQLQQELTEIKQEKNLANKELDRIKNLSENVMSLDDENKNLLQENEQLKHQRDTLKAENNRLSEKLKSDEFIYGAYAILLGIIATLIIQYLTRSRRRSSEWG